MMLAHGIIRGQEISNLLVFWNATFGVKNHECSIVKLIIVIRGRRGRQSDEMGALIIAKNVEGTAILSALLFEVR